MQVHCFLLCPIEVVLDAKYAKSPKFTKYFGDCIHCSRILGRVILEKRDQSVLIYAPFRSFPCALCRKVVEDLVRFAVRHV